MAHSGGRRETYESFFDKGGQPKRVSSSSSLSSASQRVASSLSSAPRRVASSSSPSIAPPRVPSSSSTSNKGPLQTPQQDRHKGGISKHNHGNPSTNRGQREPPSDKMLRHYLSPNSKNTRITIQEMAEYYQVRPSKAREVLFNNEAFKKLIKDADEWLAKSKRERRPKEVDLLECYDGRSRGKFESTKAYCNLILAHIKKNEVQRFLVADKRRFDNWSGRYTDLRPPEKLITEREAVLLCHQLLGILCIDSRAQAPAEKQQNQKQQQQLRSSTSKKMDRPKSSSLLREEVQQRSRSKIVENPRGLEITVPGTAGPRAMKPPSTPVTPTPGPQMIGALNARGSQLTVTDIMEYYKLTEEQARTMVLDAPVFARLQERIDQLLARHGKAVRPGEDVLKRYMNDPEADMASKDYIKGYHKVLKDYTSANEMKRFLLQPSKHFTKYNPVMDTIGGTKVKFRQEYDAIILIHRLVGAVKKHTGRNLPSPRDTPREKSGTTTETLLLRTMRGSSSSETTTRSEPRPTRRNSTTGTGLTRESTPQTKPSKASTSLTLEVPRRRDSTTSTQTRSERASTRFGGKSIVIPSDTPSLSPEKTSIPHKPNVSHNGGQVLTKRKGLPVLRVPKNVPQSVIEGRKPSLIDAEVLKDLEEIERRRMKIFLEDRMSSLEEGEIFEPMETTTTTLDNPKSPEDINKRSLLAMMMEDNDVEMVDNPKGFTASSPIILSDISGRDKSHTPPVRTTEASYPGNMVETSRDIGGDDALTSVKRKKSEESIVYPKKVLVVGKDEQDMAAVHLIGTPTGVAARGEERYTNLGTGAIMKATQTDTADENALVIGNTLETTPLSPLMEASSVIIGTAAETTPLSPLTKASSIVMYDGVGTEPVAPIQPRGEIVINTIGQTKPVPPKIQDRAVVMSTLAETIPKSPVEPARNVFIGKGQEIQPVSPVLEPNVDMVMQTEHTKEGRSIVFGTAAEVVPDIPPPPSRDPSPNPPPPPQPTFKPAQMNTVVDKNTEQRRNKKTEPNANKITKSSSSSKKDNDKRWNKHSPSTININLRPPEFTIPKSPPPNKAPANQLRPKPFPPLPSISFQVVYTNYDTHPLIHHTKENSYCLTASLNRIDTFEGLRRYIDAEFDLSRAGLSVGEVRIGMKKCYSPDDREGALVSDDEELLSAFAKAQEWEKAYFKGTKVGERERMVICFEAVGVGDSSGSE